MAVHNTTIIFGGGLCFFLGSFLWVEAIYASLSETAQSPWLLCMYVFLEERGTLEKLQAKKK